MIGHSVGAIELLRGILPQVVETWFAAVTFLGDPWLLLVVLLLLYWFVDRELGLRVMGLALAASALVLILKATFALGRPTVGPPVPVGAIPDVVRPLYVDAVEPGGYSFPSGHATGATVTWGAIAWLTDVGDRRKRLTAAGVVVALVATSRVVLGVHFATDVVAGVVLGVAFLAVALSVLDRFPVDAVTGTMALALLVGLLAIPVVGFGEDAQLVLGAAVGGIAVWEFVGVPSDPWPGTPSGVGYAALGFLALGVVVAAGASLPVPGGLVPTMAVAVGSVLALPAGIERVGRSRDVKEEDLTG